jgi:hypothetical protein
MEQLLEIGKWLIANWAEVLGSVTAVLVALIALFELIPGEQPEKTLYAIVDWLKKFSVKKK